MCIPQQRGVCDLELINRTDSFNPKTHPPPPTYTHTHARTHAQERTHIHNMQLCRGQEVHTQKTRNAFRHIRLYQASSRTNYRGQRGFITRGETTVAAQYIKLHLSDALIQRHLYSYSGRGTIPPCLEQCVTRSPSNYQTIPFSHGCRYLSVSLRVYGLTAKNGLP